LNIPLHTNCHGPYELVLSKAIKHNLGQGAVGVIVGVNVTEGVGVAVGANKEQIVVAVKSP
jgi:hypothetical protein